MMWARSAVGYLIAWLTLLWQRSCRKSAAFDPRPELRRKGQPYLFAVQHAQQVAALFLCDEPHLAAMVSRSGDGALLVPALRMRGIRAVRGSSRRGGRDKGGRRALSQLEDHVRYCGPALIAVDGPRGPRGTVHRGILYLAHATGAVILPVAAQASRHWVLTKTWDRMQLPKPFARLTLRFGPPMAIIDPEKIEGARAHLAQALQALDDT